MHHQTVRASDHQNVVRASDGRAVAFLTPKGWNVANIGDDVLRKTAVLVIFRSDGTPDAATIARGINSELGLNTIWG